MTFSEAAAIALYILRNGNWRHSGFDFNERRRQVLKTLPRHIVPDARVTPLPKNSRLRRFLTEAAWVRSSLRNRGGHLSLSQPPLCYVRIPKAASTSLCKSILQRRFPSLKTAGLSPEQINALADIYLMSTLPTTPCPIFTVVRNPFARIVAVYRSFFEQQQDHFIYEDYLFGILKKDFTFREFVSVVKRIPDDLKDQHLRPQHCFLKYYKKNNVRVEAMKMEEPERIRAFLNGIGLAFDEINRRDVAYDYREYYDSETFDIVQAIYRDDIATFGYWDKIAELQFIIEQGRVRI